MGGKLTIIAAEMIPHCCCFSVSARGWEIHISIDYHIPTYSAHRVPETSTTSRPSPAPKKLSLSAFSCWVNFIVSNGLRRRRERLEASPTYLPPVSITSFFAPCGVIDQIAGLNYVLYISSSSWTSSWTS